MEFEVKTRPLTRINALSQALVIKHLMRGDSSCREIAEDVGMAYTSVQEYCRALRRQGLLYVVRHDPDMRGRRVMPVYKLGYGVDAPRVPLTGAQRQLVCRRRRKQAVLLGLRPSNNAQGAQA